MNKEMLLAVLQRPIAFHRVFAEISGSVTSGLFLSQLFYWHDKGKDPDGWIYKTYAEWQQETTMSRKELDIARKQLKSLKILEEKKEGIPAKLFYRINFDALSESINGIVKPLSLNELLEIYDSHLLGLSRTGLMRSQKAGVECEFVDYRELLKQKGMTCGICQEPILMGVGQSGGCLVFDHITPLCHGGSHTFDNIQPAHAFCNASKSGNVDPTKQSSLLSLDKQGCLAKASKASYLKQTNLYTEITPETSSSRDAADEVGQVDPFYTGQARQIAREIVKTQRQINGPRNFITDAPWGALAEETGKDALTVFQEFEKFLIASNSDKKDPGAYAARICSSIYQNPGSEHACKPWQKFADHFRKNLSAPPAPKKREPRQPQITEIPDREASVNALKEAKRAIHRA